MKKQITKQELIDIGSIVFVEGDSQLHNRIEEVHKWFMDDNIPCDVVTSIYKEENQRKLFELNPDVLVVQSVFTREETKELFEKVFKAKEAGLIKLHTIISVFDSSELLGACNSLDGTYIHIGYKIDDGIYSLSFNTIDEISHDE